MFLNSYKSSDISVGNEHVTKNINSVLQYQEDALIRKQKLITTEPRVSYKCKNIKIPWKSRSIENYFYIPVKFLLLNLLPRKGGDINHNQSTVCGQTHHLHMNNSYLTLPTYEQQPSSKSIKQ